MEDGKLHKGFHYKDGNYSDGNHRDGNYMFGRKKKRSLSKDISDFYGLPYRIYYATPGYVYKNNSDYIGIIIEKNIIEIKIGLLKI